MIIPYAKPPSYDDNNNNNNSNNDPAGAAPSSGPEAAAKRRCGAFAVEGEAGALNLTRYNVYMIMCAIYGLLLSPVSVKKTPEKKTHGETSFKNTKPGGGKKQFLPRVPRPRIS